MASHAGTRRGLCSRLDLVAFQMAFEAAVVTVEQVLALGADIVIHSVTKYLAGHNDVLAGALAGSSELVAAVRSGSQFERIIGIQVFVLTTKALQQGLHTVSLHATSSAIARTTALVAAAFSGPALPTACTTRVPVAPPQVRLMHNVLGGTIDPHAAFLVTRGLKTLALRVRHVNASALELAKRLEAHPKISRVHYPGAPRHLS